MAPHKTSSPRSYTPPSLSPNPTFLPQPIFPRPSQSKSIASMDSTQEYELEKGVYVPTITPFKPGTEDVDVEALKKHVKRLSETGIKGIAVQGSNGEAVNMTHEERNLVTSTTRKALDDADQKKMPVIVGCGAQSLRETISLCHQAHENGGNYALVLPPSYYSSLFLPTNETVIEYFTKVADASPIPILIYNYPKAVSGLDLNSDHIVHLAQHPNIVGVKLTCGDCGKLNRIVSATKSRAPPGLAPTTPPFLVLGGSADFTTQALTGGGHGILAGLANIAPRTCVRIMTFWRQGDEVKARELQETVAIGDWQVIQTGVVGTKSAMETYFGYGGFARAPLPKPSRELDERLEQNLKQLMDHEMMLDSQAKALNGASTMH